LDSPVFITRFVTWVWIAVYVITPPVFLYFLVIGVRDVGKKAESGMRFSNWGRAVFFLLSAFGIIFGLVLFSLPGIFSPLWPWNVPPLASRAVGAWMTTLGVAAATVAWKNDRVNARGTLASLLVFCALQLIVLLRYPASVDFDNPLAWGYLLFLLLGMAAPGAGLLKRASPNRRDRGG